MPLSTVALDRATSKVDATSNTPAGLPSGHVSFQDALGRETALDRQRAKPTAKSPKSEKAEKSTRAAKHERRAKSGEKKSARAGRSGDAAKKHAAAADRKSHELNESLAALATDAHVASVDPSSPPSDPLAESTIAKLGANGASGADGSGVTGASHLGTDELSKTLETLGLGDAAELDDATLATAELRLREADGATRATDASGAADSIDLLDASGTHDGDSTARATNATATSSSSFGTTLAELQLHARAAFDLTNATTAHGATHDDARIASLASRGDTNATSTTSAVDRAVALADLPRALADRVDGFLKVRGHGDRWSAELRLDPPELGTLHVRFELRGHELHGVVHVQDRRLEPQLTRLFHDLNENLREQGRGGASFEFSRGAREEGEGRAPPSSAVEPPFALAGVASRSDRGAGPDVSRLVDLLA